MDICASTAARRRDVFPAGERDVRFPRDDSNFPCWIAGFPASGDVVSCSSLLFDEWKALRPSELLRALFEGAVHIFRRTEALSNAHSLGADKIRRRSITAGRVIPSKGD